MRHPVGNSSQLSAEKKENLRKKYVYLYNCRKDASEGMSKDVATKSSFKTCSYHPCADSLQLTIDGGHFLLPGWLPQRMLHLKTY